MASRRSIALLTGLLVSGIAGSALAGDGSKPASMTVTGELLVTGMDAAQVVHAAGQPIGVVETTADGVGNPEGITIIRAANHKITRPGVGKALNLLRAVGSPDGAIFVLYTQPNFSGGKEPHLRKVNADNSTAFDHKILLDRLAAVTPDGAGGVYFASHHSFPLPNSLTPTQTEIKMRRYGGTGELLWEAISEVGTNPIGDSSHWVTAARGEAGVDFGYAVGDASDAAMPVLERRNPTDGTLVFRQAAFKKPSTSTNVRVAGAPGTTAMPGRISKIMQLADGSVIAEVDTTTTTNFIVRVDAGGKQTAAYVCDNGAIVPLGSDELGCAKLTQGGIALTRYGVVKGVLVARVKHELVAPSGWVLGHLAALPGKQLIVAAQKDGKVANVLYGSDGKLLTKTDVGSVGQFVALDAIAGKWLGYGPGEGGKWVRRWGTYSVGGVPPAVNANQPPAALPRH